ncbi:MAG: type II secretion system protein GspD [Kiritimatiellia bacterium]
MTARLLRLAGAAAAVPLAAAGAISAPAITNVATFAVQVTNQMFLAVSPLTNDPFAVQAPYATNVVANALATTNAVTETGTSTNVPSLLLIDTNRLDKAVAAAVKKAAADVAAAAAASETALRARRVDTRSFPLRHASATEVAERINAMWSGDFGLGWKLDKVAQAFSDANVVMVTAPGVVLDACERVVRDVDVETRQVYVEARFVELSNNASHKLGIDWRMLDGMHGVVSMNTSFDQRRMVGVQSVVEDGSTTKTTYGDGGIGRANLSRVQGTIGMSDLYVILRALEASEDARTFSNPKIIVASGRKATVDMTTKYPNVTIAVKKTINDNSTSVDLDMKMAAIPGEDKMMFAKEAFFSWGISLEVTPRVGADGLIHVEIVPTVSAKTDEVSAGSGDADSDSYSARYPVIEVQRLVTEFNMASGSTAVIGGLSRTIETQMDNGIPWLRDWWWIGPRLFGSKVRVKEQKEILVFVTVGLVDAREIKEDVGLPKNAVLGRQFTEGILHEPGDRIRQGIRGMDSLDLRSLEDQAHDPRRTNRTVVVRGEIERLKRRIDERLRRLDGAAETADGASGRSGDPQHEENE